MRRKIGITARDHWVRVTKIIHSNKEFYPIDKVYVSKKSRIKIITRKSITKTYGKNLHGIMYVRLLVSNESAIIAERLIPVNLIVSTCL